MTRSRRAAARRCALVLVLATSSTQIAGCASGAAPVPAATAPGEPEKGRVASGAHPLAAGPAGQFVTRLDELDFLLGVWEARLDNGSVLRLSFDRVRFGSNPGIEVTWTADSIPLVHIASLIPDEPLRLWDLETYCAGFAHIPGVWPVRRVGPHHVRAWRYEWRRIGDDLIEVRMDVDTSEVVMRRVAGRGPVRDPRPSCIELAPAAAR